MKIIHTHRHKHADLVYVHVNGLLYFETAIMAQILSVKSIFLRVCDFCDA